MQARLVCFNPECRKYYAISEVIYQCRDCGALLEAEYDLASLDPGELAKTWTGRQTSRGSAMTVLSASASGPSHESRERGGVASTAIRGTRRRDLGVTFCPLMSGFWGFFSFFLLRRDARVVGRCGFWGLRGGAAEFWAWVRWRRLSGFARVFGYLDGCGRLERPGGVSPLAPVQGRRMGWVGG